MQDKGLNDKRVKVCFVVTKGVWGGAQKYVYSLATRLQSPEASSNGGQASLPKDRFDVLVVTGAGDVLREKLERQGIRVFVIENLKRDISIKAEIKSFFELFNIIRKERPDVLHLNSPKAGGLGGLAGRILFIKKIIYTAHGWTFNEERNPLHQTLIAFFSWLTIILCHRTIVIAEKEKKQAQTMPFVRDSKIVLIHNGIEKINFKEKDTARTELMSKRLFDTTSNPIWFGTVAELHKNKGLEYAIEAVSKIKTPFVYLIIGEGEERKNLENIIQKYDLEDKVFLIGFVEKANEYLKAFDVLMLTSVKEGLPYTLLEAGQAGLPVIASNIGGIPDIIENGVSGILTTKARPGEITRAIEYMIDKPQERKSFGKKLQQKVEKDFSFEQMQEKIEELYKI